MFSRRNLFRSSVALCAGATLTASARAATDPKPAEGGVHDVVILGAGVGGLVCAIEARALGLDVVVLEKM